MDATNFKRDGSFGIRSSSTDPWMSRISWVGTSITYWISKNAKEATLQIEHEVR